MKPTSLCLVLALISGGAYAQSMMEHAAAAAGATVGTVGGKVLSNAIDQTLNKAAAAATQTNAAPDAQRPGKVAPNPNSNANSSPAEIAPPASPGLPPVPAAPVRRARAAAAAPAQPAFALPEPPVFAPAPPPPTVEDFAKVKEGGARQDVFAALGTPSSHVTIPDEGHLIEILSYFDGRRRVGSVRLDNGQVVSITTAP